MEQNVILSSEVSFFESFVGEMAIIMADTMHLLVPCCFFLKLTAACCLQLKRLSEHERFSLLKEKLDTLELKLEAESHNRQDAHRSLEAHVEAELLKLSDRTSAELKQMHLSIKSTMEQLTRAATDLNSSLSQESEQRAADIDHVGMSLCEKVDQVVHTVEEERFARLEQERQSLKRCAFGHRLLQP
jgi:DNA anti-recombination protein RmuC